AASTDFYVSSLLGAIGRINGGWSGLYLCNARRRPDAGEVGDGRKSAQSAGGVGGHVEAFGTDGAQTGIGGDPTSAAGVQPPSRVVPTHDRRRLRPDRSSYRGGGFDHRVHAPDG